MTSLDTERLTLRTWTLGDFEAYAAMHADAQVMQFLGADGNPMSRFRAWQSLSTLIGHWALRGFGMFAVVERSSGDLLGRVGPWQPEGWPDFEIGWTLRSQSWGRGYATEAANACLRYAFTVLDRPHVISLIAPDNLRSIRVAERLGERLEAEVTLPDLPSDRKLLQYGVTKDEWRRR